MTSGPSTLYEAVRQHGLTAEECVDEYGAFLSLSTRIVGIPMTKFASIAHLSPLTIKPYMGILRSMFRVPTCDFGVGAINGRQRRLLLLGSSATHGCAFCSAHTALMGDAMGGSRVQQCYRAGTVVVDVKEDGDDEINALVAEVCSFPARVTEETRANFVAKFGEKGYQDAASMLAFMGWLNYNMDVLEMTLESEVAPFAQMILAPRNLPFDVTDIADEKDGQAALGKERVKAVTGEGIRNPWSRAWAYVNNAWSFLQMFPNVVKALSIEKEWFHPLPYSLNDLAVWRRKNFGCDLTFDQGMENEEVKRALTFICREVLLKDEITKWTRAEKYKLLYIFGKGLGNEVLVSEAVALETARVKNQKAAEGESADPSIGSTSEVRKELDNVFATASSDAKPFDAFSSAANLIFHAAGPSGQVAKSGSMKEFLQYVTVPSVQMEIIGMIGLFAMMHRTSIMCGPKE